MAMDHQNGKKAVPILGQLQQIGFREGGKGRTGQYTVLQLRSTATATEQCKSDHQRITRGKNLLSGVGRRFFKLETLDRGARARLLLRPSSSRWTWSPRSARAGGATAGGMEPALTGYGTSKQARRRFLYHGASSG